MTPEEHQQVKELFLAVCLRPPEERAKFLDVVCPNDAIRAEVERLLRHHADEKTPIDANADQPGRASLKESSPAAVVRVAQDQASGFEPGQWIAERFRLRDRIGSGGMGEIWRADDTLVGRDVALKFLPRAVSRNPAWMRLLRREVRVASAITHPNVCRTYDLFQADGELLVSMEYVHGEDLAALLRKVGRLPADKAIAIARQVCSALAAAHAKGVLHRDLKPANILIDLDGVARLTDFGLATARENILPEHVRSGTPAYMAPEQAAGRDVSERSDLYALGLVLYELHTGVPVFRGSSLEDYEALHRDQPPTPPSAWVPDIDPAVERTILNCLRKDPDARPASAIALLAALPGGELLSELVTTGQVPSPEVVAMAGGAGGLSRRSAIGLTVAFLALLAGTIAVCNLWNTGIVNREFESTSVLAHMAREELDSAGWSHDAGYEAYGFADPRDVIRSMCVPDNSRADTAQLALPHNTDPVFWLRRSPARMSATDAHARLFEAGRLTPGDPPMTVPGMCTAFFSGEGRLVAMLRTPSVAESTRDPGASPDADRLLHQFGLEPANAKPAASSLKPAITHTARRTWDVDVIGGAARLEAAFLGPTPVFAALVHAGQASPDAGAARRGVLGPRTVELVRLMLTLLMLPAALAFARDHLRKGLGDTRGAFRLAGTIFATSIFAWVLLGAHSSSVESELQSLVLAVVGALCVGTLVWCFYVALEPYVRRLWPQTLISWSRLLLGHWRDPRVGRDLFIGATLGVAWALLLHADWLLSARLGLVSGPMPRDADSLTILLGGRHAVGVYAIAALRALYLAMLFVMVIVALRLFLRHAWVASLAAVLVISLMYVPQGGHPLVSWATIGVGAVGVATWAMTRYGLVSVATGMFVTSILVRSPISYRMETWYGGIGLLAVGLTVAIAVYGLVICQRRPGSELRPGSATG